MSAPPAASSLRRARGRCPGIPVRIADDAHGQDLLGASLSLAQTQIAGQLAEETSLDSRTMGVLGFAGALLGAGVAGKSLLGSQWWVVLIPLGIAATACLSSLLRSGSAQTDLGPEAGAFYAGYMAHPLKIAREQMLAEVLGALERNSQRLDVKRRALRVSVVSLAFGLPLATVSIAMINHRPLG